MAAEQRGQMIRPYGDTRDDGALQLSFTLPVPAGGLAREAARRLCAQMGIPDAAVAYMKDLGSGHTFVIAYGHCQHAVDISQIHVPEVAGTHMDMAAVCEYARSSFDRALVIVGACTGSDAHTVGLDAILGAKGFRGDYGLERYPVFQVHNLGSQVPNAVLVARARELKADAVLVSQVVTQKNGHLTNLSQLVDLMEAEGIRENVILICGGPRISHELAIELGFDAGFGPGTLPAEVASYIVTESGRRLNPEAT